MPHKCQNPNSEQETDPTMPSLSISRRTTAQHVTPSIFWVATVAIVLMSGTACAQTAGNWHFFSINAQYRGGVKQGFKDLGCGTTFDTAMPGGERRVVFHACVSHPEKAKKYYAMRMDLCFKQEAASVTTTRKNYVWFNEDFPADQRDQVADMVQLLPMIFSGELVAKPVKTMQINQSQFQINLAMGKNGKSAEIEVRIQAGEPVEGKFFLERNAASGYDLTKFRLKKGKISTSFVCANQADIMGKYAKLPPFDKLVFGN